MNFDRTYYYKYGYIRGNLVTVIEYFVLFVSSTLFLASNPGRLKIGLVSRPPYSKNNTILDNNSFVVQNAKCRPISIILVL